jgi:hypothetical protein
MHHRDHERVRKHATEEVEKRSNSKNTWRLILIYRQLLKSKNPTTNLIGSLVLEFDGTLRWVLTDLYYELVVLTNQCLGPILEASQNRRSVEFRN